MDVVIKAADVQGGVAGKLEVGPQLLLILWMVSGWKSFLVSRVDITTLLLGRVLEAFSITDLSP